jgi:hypothetical protein
MNFQDRAYHKRLASLAGRLPEPTKAELEAVCMKRLLIVGFVLLSGAAEAADRLPKEMLGVWATELAACSETASEIKMTVEPKIILYYEVAQTVRKTAKQRNGSLRVFGQTVDLEGKAPTSIDLKLDGDTLVVGRTNGRIYLRCPKDSPK